MILVGSQRGGASQLAAHLMNTIDNEHVEMHEIRGFIARSLRGALNESHAISKATKCSQFMFSLSVNPPRDANVPVSDLVKAIDQAEKRLGLAGQPRAIVIHEKEGRRHAHAVWSRIDAVSLTAINMPYYKNRLNELSKSLYLEHGWELPEGHRTNGWSNPLNFSLAEWQQAKRLNLDPREIKQIFQQAYHNSDGLRAFRSALEQSGYFLARGDRRGYVAVDMRGEVFSVARYAGIKTRELRGKFGNPDHLPNVQQTTSVIRQSLSKQVRSFMREVSESQKNQAEPFNAERKSMIAVHRIERAKLKRAQDRRWKAESKERNAKFRTGLLGVADWITGRRRQLKRANELEVQHCYKRDAQQRERLFLDQQKERQSLQIRIDRLREQHRDERLKLMHRVAGVLRRNRDDDASRAQKRSQNQDYSLDR